MEPTAAEIQACNQQQMAYNALMAKWTVLKTRINGPGGAPAAGAAGAKKK